jgi:hypothetical protein
MTPLADGGFFLPSIGHFHEPKAACPGASGLDCRGGEGKSGAQGNGHAQIIGRRDGLSLKKPGVMSNIDKYRHPMLN